MSKSASEQARIFNTWRFGAIYNAHNNSESLSPKGQVHLTMENAFSPSATVSIVLTVPEVLKSLEIPLRPKANT
jgi:hypothetical protein